MKIGTAISLLVVLMCISGCGAKPDRDGKITLDFTITDTMNALLRVPLVDLHKGENIEVIIYDFSGHNVGTYIMKPTGSAYRLYFFRFKNERLVKYGPVTSLADKLP